MHRFKQSPTIVVPLYLLLKYHKFVSASEACFMRIFTQIRLKKMNSCFLLVLFPSMLQWKLLSYQTVV